MPDHRISRAKAREMVTRFKQTRSQGPNKLPPFPDGYIFEAAQVKSLLDNPEAYYFIISLGIKETLVGGVKKEEVSPILTVADSNYKILNGGGTGSQTGTDAALLSADSDTSSTTTTDDGYLDESKPYPPPPIDL